MIRVVDFELVCSIRINCIYRIVIDICIEIGAAIVSDGVAVDEPSGAGVVVAVSEQRQARLRVGVVAPPAPEARVGVKGSIRARPKPEGVEGVGA